MTTGRFHRAAKDGLLQVLREATSSECNKKDESGMTPTLWAAFEGHYDALRLLCGRGGDPDKADHFGNTALHLAAAHGHKECVTFLINCGANVFAMDVNGHTAQQLAAINERDDILLYLDQATAKLENNDKKKANALKEKAKKDYEKSHKRYQKRQSKAELMAEKDLKKRTKEWDQGYAEEVTIMPHRPSNVLSVLRQKMTKSTGHGSLLPDDQPREPVGPVYSGARGRGTVSKKAFASKLRNNTNNGNTDDFKVTTEMTGRRSVTSISGIRRDSEVMYVTFDTGPQQTGDSSDTLAEEPHEPTVPKKPITRSVDHTDFGLVNEDSGIEQEVTLQEPASMFSRPWSNGVRNLVFRKSITTMCEFDKPGDDFAVNSTAIHAYEPANWTSTQSDSSTIASDEETEAEDSTYASLEMFLAAFGLYQYVQKFKDEQIDLDALMLLTESDLQALRLPIGPHRKLVTAIQDRKQALSHSGPAL